MNTSVPYYQRFRKSGLLGFSLFALVLILANSGNPPNGRTGAPGDGACTNCHSANSASLDGEVSITGLPATIMAGTTYPITVTLTNPNGNAVRGGFQWVALDGSNTNAGTINNPMAGTTVTMALGKMYHEHNPAMNFPASNSLTWTADWTAPTGPDGDNITLYVGSIIANGSGTSGDRARFNSTSGTLMAAGMPVTVVSDNIVDVDCFGDATGSADAVASGGMTPYTYLWSDGQTTMTASGLTAGNYSVTVTDNSMATASTQIAITEPTELILSVQSNNSVSCQGGNDGSATVLATGGTSPYLYSWSNGTTGSINTGLAAGNYTVTVIDNQLCETTLAVGIADGVTVSAASILEQDVSCNGAADGKIEVLASGGVAPYIYDWSSGQATALIEDLSPNTYMVTVTDFNGCSNVSDYTITEPLAIIINVLNETDASCFGNTNGQLSVEALNGTAPYQYNWSTGDTGPILSNLAAGSYELSITDANSCMRDTTFIITQPDSLIISLLQKEDITCNGDMDGLLEVSVAPGGIGPFSYSWSNMMTTSTITNLSAGTYSVTATDGMGCTNEATYEVLEPFPLIANISSEPEFETGSMDGSAMVSPAGGVSPYMILWSNMETGFSIQNLSQGSYTATVTDTNNCTAVETVIVSLSTCDLTATANTTGVSCFGDTDGSATLNITNAIGTPAIIWSNGSDSITIENLPGGSYSATITDDINCEVIVNNILINEPGELMAFPRIASSIECAGDSTGAVTATIVGGTAPFSYLWSTGSTNDTLSNISSGSYGYTITDANDCSIEGFMSIGNSDLARPTLLVRDFTIYIDSSGMVESYDETNFDIGSTDNCGLAGFTFDELDLECNEVGEYEIGIALFDVNGNVSRDSVTVTLADTIAPIFACNTDTLRFNGCNIVSYARPLVNDNCSIGTLDIELTEGLTNGSIFPIGNTDIVYTATDPNGNVSSCHFVIAVDVDLSVEFNTEDPTCFNFNDGSVEILVTNSVAGDSTVTLVDGFDPNFLGEGTYQVIVQDASMCTVTDSFTIVDPPVLIVDMTDTVDPSTSNSNDGSIDISVSGGTGLLSYEWSLDGVLLADTTQDLTDLGPGTYQVVIRDEIGCSFTSLEIVLDALVSISSTNINSLISFYPNPVTDQVFIKKQSDKIVIDKLMVYDAQGRLALNAPTIYEDICVDMRTLAKGIYFIKIYVEGNVSTQKVIKL